MINGKKVIGIIGGMGPMATVDLFQKIVQMTDAGNDSEHIHVLIDNNTSVPDRTSAILSGSDTPVSAILESARRLETMGADFLLLSCNAAHFYHSAVSAKIGIPILNMPEETAKRVASLGMKCVGLLATDGALKGGVYDRAFEKCGISTVKPDEAGQHKLMHMVYNEVKAGKKACTEALESTLDDMAERGAQAFVLGCTELPVAYRGCNSRLFIDPTSVLAASAIRAAGYSVRLKGI